MQYQGLTSLLLITVGRQRSHNTVDCAITSDILQPGQLNGNSKMYGNEPRYNETHFPGPLTLRYIGIILQTPVSYPVFF